jgi:hypothetical protein
VHRANVLCCFHAPLLLTDSDQINQRSFNFSPLYLFNSYIKKRVNRLFLDGQQFSDFMQEMLVMMDNVENEVGAQPHADFIS